MRSLFKSEGRSCIAVSIDDFYLTGELMRLKGFDYEHDVYRILRQFIMDNCEIDAM
jgi:hypothetical protein